MEKRYRALRVIVVLFKIQAVLVLVFGGISGLAQIFGGVNATRGGGLDGSLLAGLGVAGGFVTLVAASMAALGLFAVAEAIKVVLDIEENTRRTALECEGRPL